MILKYYLLIAILLLFPVSGAIAATNGQLMLSRELINDFLQTSQEIAKLKQELPNIQQFSDAKAVKTTDQIVAYLQASEAFPEIQSILSSTDFSDLHEFFRFSERLMAVRLYLQMENSTQASIFQTIDILQANLNSMRANNASKEIILRAEQVLEQQQIKAALIKTSLEKLTEQDKNFVQQNQQWLIELFTG
jgi:hypothetical protein